MALIIVMTNKNDSHLGEVMRSALEKNGGMGEIKRLADIRRARRFKNCLITLKKPPQHRFRNAVSVFDSAYRGDANPLCGTSVFASSCKDILSSMAHSDCVGISCGTGPLDTLSVGGDNRALRDNDKNREVPSYISDPRRLRRSIDKRSSARRGVCYVSAPAYRGLCLSLTAALPTRAGKAAA